MLHAQQAQQAAAIDANLLEDQDMSDGGHPGKQKVKAKRFKGLLEWILDREGNEYLVEVDRGYLKDKQNLTGIKEQFQQSLGPSDEISDN